MNAKIQKWGNSQGLRIAKPLLESAHFMVGEELVLTAEEGRITLTPAQKAQGKWQPGRGGGDITKMAAIFEGRFKQKIDIKAALAKRAREKYGLKK